MSTNSASIRFLYPKFVGNPTHIDGEAEGYITLGNTGAQTTTINSITVTLKKTDNVPSNETTLGSYSKTLSTGNEIVQNSTLKIPFSIPVANKEITYDEKIILIVEHTNNGQGTVNIIHDNDSTYEDIKIKIPYQD